MKRKKNGLGGRPLRGICRRFFLLLSISFLFPSAAVFAQSKDLLWGGQPLKATKHAVIRFPNGAKIRADVADTQMDRERGLMFRKKLPKKYGMLFVFPEDDPNGLEFWMKDTLVSLDIIFIGADKKITSIAGSLKASTPQTSDADVARARGHGLYVLELPAGAAKRLKLHTGSQLQFNAEIPPR